MVGVGFDGCFVVVDGRGRGVMGVILEVWLGLLMVSQVSYLVKGRTVWVVAGMASPVSAGSGVDGLKMKNSRALLVALRVGVGALATGPHFGGHALLGGLLASSGSGHHGWVFGVGEGILSMCWL